MKKLAIIVATEYERKALLKIMTNVRERKLTEAVTVYEGRVGKTALCMARSGMGKVAAAFCAQTLIDFCKPSAIINVGVAGSLDKELHIGELLLAKDAVQHDYDASFFDIPKGMIDGIFVREFAADEELLARLCETCEKLDINYKAGRIVSGDQFISDEAVKERLVSEFGGNCCEMEGAAIAQVCYVNKLPFAIVRAISDNADGQAGPSYDEFAPVAAENAARVIEELCR